jgi:hypothetical protein
MEITDHQRHRTSVQPLILGIEGDAGSGQAELGRATCCELFEESL